MRFRMTLFVILLAAMAAAVAYAQVTTASIFGTVTDNTGAVVPNAQITVTNVETNVTRTAKSDSAGQYTVPLLPTGTYRVDISSAGFKKFEQTGIVLDVSRTARVDATLEIGAVAETVSVTADAPLVNTSNASIG